MSVDYILKYLFMVNLYRYFKCLKYRKYVYNLGIYYYFILQGFFSMNLVNIQELK